MLISYGILAISDKLRATNNHSDCLWHIFYHQQFISNDVMAKILFGIPLLQDSYFIMLLIKNYEVINIYKVYCKVKYYIPI